MFSWINKFKPKPITSPAQPLTADQKLKLLHDVALGDVELTQRNGRWHISLRVVISVDPYTRRYHGWGATPEDAINNVSSDILSV